MRVLFAIDPGQEAERLVERARGLLDRLGATVDLLTVPSPVPGGVGGELAQRLEAAVLEEDRGIRVQLERWLARLAPADRRGQCLVRRDANPAQAILALSEGYALVVVGTHGRSGMSRLWLGSVAERVVRTSPVPVLVLHDGGADAARMLVAVDLSDPMGVIEAAGAWAERLGLPGDAVWVRRLEEREVPERSSSALTARLAAWPEPLRGVGRVQVGEPIATIAELAADGYGLVVVGTHGRTGLEHWRMGSVAERIVRHSPVPVLVVR